MFMNTIMKEFDSTNMLETLFCAKNELEWICHNLIWRYNF